MPLMQHIRKIGGALIARSAARSADREAKERPKVQFVRGGWWLVQVSTEKHPLL